MIDILFVVPDAVLGVVVSLSIGFILIEVYPCLDERRPHPENFGTQFRHLGLHVAGAEHKTRFDGGGVEE